MWFPLLAMAVAVSLEPFRIGMTVLMINRPRPGLQLLTFLAGGFAMGITVGLIVLFVLRPALGSAHFTLPRVQLVVGAVVLVNAALVAGSVLARRGAGQAPGSPGRLRRALDPVAVRARALVQGGSLWTAGIAGLGIALPSIDYVAALTLIVASGAAAATQVGALMLFNVVAFTLVEIPLLCYVIAPERTRATLATLYDWVRSRGRLGVAALLAVAGALLLGVGFAGL